MTISILIPCYNEEPTIRACVESCLRQTRPLDEIIVVNDGSTDGSRAVLEEFGDRVTVLDTPQNSSSSTPLSAIFHSHSRSFRMGSATITPSIASCAITVAS